MTLCPKPNATFAVQTKPGLPIIGIFPGNYDLTVDSSVGPEKAAETILDYIAAKHIQ